MSAADWSSRVVEVISEVLYRQYASEYCADHLTPKNFTEEAAEIVTAIEAAGLAATERETNVHEWGSGMIPNEQISERWATKWKVLTDGRQRVVRAVTE